MSLQVRYEKLFDISRTISVAPLTALTRARDTACGNETFQVTETLETNGGGQRVRMHQIVAGVVVDASNEVSVDATGKILELATVLVPSDFAPISPLISHTDARSRAIAAWEALESTKFRPEGPAPRGTLMYRPRSSMNDLELIYEFRFIGGLPLN
jgi:hypothetical protein